MPTSRLYGAGLRTVPELNAKKADERMALDDLRKATKVVALTLLDLLCEKDAENFAGGKANYLFAWLNWN